MKKLMISMLAMAAMVSCTNEIEGPYQPKVNENEPVAVEFGQSINLYTKAPVTGDKLASTKIGIWAQKHSGTPAWAATNLMDNISLSVDGDGAITYTTTSEKVYYSFENDAKYDFYAYTPYADKATNGLEITAAGAGTAPNLKVTLDPANKAQTDIMYADPTNLKNKVKSTDPIALPFKHALAQVKFKIQKEQSLSDAMTLSAIKVSANTTGTMDISNGNFTNIGTPGDFIALSSDNITIPAKAASDDSKAIDAGDPIMVFPKELGDNAVTFTIGGKDYTFKPSATLTAGAATTITVTVTATGVSFTQSLTDWTPESGTGTIQ
uniref:fimbrillin family protein n=1 Tax=Parabacteroides distasonis TaxID=823 RepID=UPI0040266916